MSFLFVTLLVDDFFANDGTFQCGESGIFSYVLTPMVDFGEKKKKKALSQCTGQNLGATKSLLGWLGKKTKPTPLYNLPSQTIPHKLRHEYPPSIGPIHMAI